jgi:hypothetical protein
MAVSDAATHISEAERRGTSRRSMIVAAGAAVPMLLMMRETARRALPDTV